MYFGRRKAQLHHFASNNNFNLCLRVQAELMEKDAVRVTKYIETISAQAAPELKLAGAQILFRGSSSYGGG